MAPPPIAYLEDVASKFPALAGTCQTLRDLYERKLWHELSLEVARVFEMPDFINSGLLADTYMNFVSDFGHKINLLYLAKFAQAVAKQYQDVGVATTFLESQIAGLEELKRPQTVEPILYLKMQIAELKVYSQDEAGCKELFEAGLTQIESMQDVDPSVSAAVHSVRALYYKAKQDFSSYYRAALTYLCYVSLDTLTPDVKLNLAVDISFAALLGDGVYSFAELLLHPIVKVLDGSPYAWLAELLNCFSSGDMVLYEQLCAKHAAAMNAQPALVAAERQLREKITIMCLVALLHSLPTDARRVSLATIAARTRLDIDGTEFLLMKAFSLQLVRGSIDEIDGFVDITWVAPRVLTLPEIAGIQSHLQNWVAKVDAATGLLESEGVSTVEALA